MRASVRARTCVCVYVCFVFVFCFQIIGFDISCKLPPQRHLHEMSYHIFRKSKETILKLSSAKSFT